MTRSRGHSVLASLATALLVLPAARASAEPRVTRLGRTAAGLELLLSPSPRDLEHALEPGGARTTGFLFVVAPGARPSLRVLAETSRTIVAPFRPDSEPVPTEPVRLKERARVGAFDVVRVEVALVREGPSPDRWLVPLSVRVVLDDGGTLTRSAALPAGGSAHVRDGDGGRSVPAGASRGALARPGPAEELVLQMAVNGREARSWRRPRDLRPAPAGPALPSCPGCLAAEVTRDGVYRVDAALLLAYSAFASGDPREIHVYLRGLEVPVEIDGEDDGRLDAGDALVFLGERNRGVLSDTTAYWIAPPDGTRGVRVDRRSAFAPGDERLPALTIGTGILRIEEQTLFDNKAPAGDPWMSAFLYSNQTPARVDLPTVGGAALPDLVVAPPGSTYRLRARFVGRSSVFAADDQEVSLALNGMPVTTFRWEASLGLDRTFELPWDPVALGTTANRVRLDQLPPANPAFSRFNYVDYLELEYPRRLRAGNGVLDCQVAGGGALMLTGFRRTDTRIYVREDTRVTRLVAPRVLQAEPNGPRTLVAAWHPETTGTARVVAAEPQALMAPDRLRPLSSASLRALAGGPYLAITHPRFLAEAQALAAYRGGIAVDLTDVYDQFSFSMEDVDAIKRFLTVALEDFPTPPRYVALVGDASGDPRNHRAIVDPAYDPPSLLHLADVWLDSAGGLRAGSDMALAAAVGDDFVPDVAIGRIPARLPGDLGTYLAKVQAYEAQAPASASWMSRLHLLADDDVNGDGSECGIPGQVATDLDALVATYLPLAAPPDIVRRYAGTYASPGAPQAIVDDLVADFTAGVGVRLYAGHGNALTLGRQCEDGGLSLENFEMLPRIQNGDREALSVAMTCDAGDVGYVSQVGPTATLESIAEHFLKAPDRGDVAWIATTSVLVYTTGIDLTDALFSVLYAGDPVGPPDNRVLGSIATGIALRHFAIRGDAAHDGILSLIAIGDPALELRAGTP